ncbi:MAG: hypothetical protein DMF44_15115 [Verrucomicrobia bacterium]|nr:MAG: hypothetical protein DMF44_15115 [Verrucomicrobiota bacterium]
MFGAGNTRRHLLGAVSLLMLAGTSARPAPQVTSTGFLVNLEVKVNAPVAKVYDALIGQVGSWWNPEHTYFYVAPREVLRFSGGLGPLQASGIAGSMTWKLTSDRDQTRIQLSYSVGGFVVGGFDRIAPAVESMLNEQLNRLKLFAETGKPTTEQ